MREYRFEDITVGMQESFTAPITAGMEDAFREMTGDDNPLHRDDAFAREIGGGKWKGHVTFGMLTASLYSTLAGMYLPGKYSLIHSLDTKFLKPVYAGDQLTVTGTVTKKHEELKLIEIKAQMTNREGVCVSKANIKVLVQK